MNKENIMSVNGENRENTGNALNTKKYDKTDGIFALIYVLLGYCFVKFFIFYDWGSNFEFTFRLFTARYIATVLYYAKAKNVTPPKEAFFWIGIMMANRLFFKIEFFFMLVIQICVATYFTAVTGRLLQGGTGRYIVYDLWETFLAKPFGNFFSIFPAGFTLLRKREKKEKQTVSPVVWGVLAAAGALWFILPLLTSADNNFLSGTTEFIDHFFAAFSSGDVIYNIILAGFSVPVTMYMFGLGYACFHNNYLRDMTKCKVYKAREDMRISPAITLQVFMYIICGAYILFMILQIQYLFGAFTGNLYPGMTYSRYARTGFFELCRVAGINLTLLAVTNLVNKKEDTIKTAQLLLCVLSLLLLSTAMAKMGMYIAAYGLTYKRVVSSVFLIWLMIVFRLCILRLYKPFNIVKVAVITGAVMFSVMFSFDISFHCHNYNAAKGFDKISAQIRQETADSLYNAI